MFRILIKKNATAHSCPPIQLDSGVSFRILERCHEEPFGMASDDEQFAWFRIKDKPTGGIGSHKMFLNRLTNPSILEIDVHAIQREGQRNTSTSCSGFSSALTTSPVIFDAASPSKSFAFECGRIVRPARGDKGPTFITANVASVIKPLVDRMHFGSVSACAHSYSRNAGWHFLVLQCGRFDELLNLFPRDNFSFV